MALDVVNLVHNRYQKGMDFHYELKEMSRDDYSESRSTLNSCINVSVDHLTRMCNDVFLHRYDIVKKIGQGSMGTVSLVKLKDNKIGGSAFERKCKGFFGLGINRKTIVIPISDRPKLSTCHLYALKTLQLNCTTRSYMDELCNEINVLRSFDHPNIIKALEVYEKKEKRGLPDQMYLVLELCTGGDLFARSPYSRREAARIVSKVVSAINYMHKHHIVHRDIKYENILFESEAIDADVKIIDFGLSKRLKNNAHPDKITERVGTTYTMAPEVLRRGYSSQADMWSIGVVTYMLLSNNKPFKSRSRNETVSLILEGRVNYDAPIWADEYAKDFVENLLVANPKQRMTAAIAGRHAWIRNREIMPDEEPSIEILGKVGHCLRQYKYVSDLKKIALNAIAHKSTSAQVSELRKVFSKLDAKREGILSVQVFEEQLRRVFCFSPEDIEEIRSSIDVRGHGHIMYTDFLAATIESIGHIGEDRIAEAFCRLDSDADGYISNSDFFVSLGPKYPEHRILSMIKCSDYDNDGKISYVDFLQNFRENETRPNICDKSLSSSWHDVDPSTIPCSDEEMQYGMLEL